MPVSNPTWFVMNGNNRLVVHGTIVKVVAAVDVSANRGIVNELEAVPPVVAVNAPELVFGAKLRFTVDAPGAGTLVDGLALYRKYTPKSKFSLIAGLVVSTSQVALAVPLTGMISA
jgi:hypothetical protein